MNSLLLVVLELLAWHARISQSQLHPARSCNLQIIVDKHLYDRYFSEVIEENRDEKERIARYNIISLAGRLVNQANKVLDRQYIGKLKYKIILKNIKILSTEELCGDICSEVKDLESLLNIFSYSSRDGYCLSYLLTYRNFVNGQLGLAFTAGPSHGGVCETFRKQREDLYGYEDETMKSLNTGVITLQRSDRQVSELLAAATFAHEIGHSFGSSHDPKECQGNQEDGTYLMYESGSLGTKKNNMVLSSCSVKDMALNLNSLDLRDSGSCWTIDSGHGSCGNSIVEVWEECDCGDDPVECEKECCVPPNDVLQRQPCKLVQGAACSPSEGLCCNSKCEFLTSEATCGAATECSKPANCTGNTPYCPLPDLFKDSTPCENGSKTCSNGQCTGSVCPSIGMLPCLPEDDSDPSTNCKPYCHSPTQQCSPAANNYSYHDGTECAVDSVYGYCTAGQCALYSSEPQSSWIVGVSIFIVFYMIFLALSIWIYCRYCRNNTKNLLTPLKTTSSSNLSDPEDNT